MAQHTPRRTPIRVALVDNYPLLRAGLRSLLALDLGVKIVAEASSAASALALIREHRPDVVLIDLRLPTTETGAAASVDRGLHLIGTLRRAAELPPTLIVDPRNRDAVVTALQLGVRGVLPRDVTHEGLASALRIEAEGGTLMTASVTRQASGPPGIERPARSAASDSQPFGLSDREMEVVQLLARGFRNREIAATLGMTEGTAKNHVSSVLAKLGVRDRFQAVLKATELGYL